MKIRSKKSLLATAGGAAFALMVATGLQAQSSPERTNTFSGSFTPLNGSGVEGTFTIEQRGQGQIRVMIDASGLEPTPNPHVAHIHGLSGSTEAVCPTLAQDEAGDNDGFIELAEGVPVYGPIIIPLGDIDPDNDGVVSYSETFNLNQSTSFADGKAKTDLFPIESREIIIHGLSLSDGDGANGGEADGTAGYKVVLPVACGNVEMDSRPGETRPKTVRF